MLSSAAGINRMDVMQRRGMYPLPPGVTPILGVEFAGIVESVGDDVKNVSKGDEV